MTGQRLVHVAIADDWEACKRFGEYEVSTRGISYDEAGFIRATNPDALASVLDLVFGDLTLPLVVAVIDQGRPDLRRHRRRMGGGKAPNPPTSTDGRGHRGRRTGRGAR